VEGSGREGSGRRVELDAGPASGKAHQRGIAGTRPTRAPGVRPSGSA